MQPSYCHFLGHFLMASFLDSLKEMYCKNFCKTFSFFQALESIGGFQGTFALFLAWHVHLRKS